MGNYLIAPDLDRSETANYPNPGLFFALIGSGGKLVR